MIRRAAFLLYPSVCAKIDTERWSSEDSFYLFSEEKTKQDCQPGLVSNCCWYQSSSPLEAQDTRVHFMEMRVSQIQQFAAPLVHKL